MISLSSYLIVSILFSGCMVFSNNNNKQLLIVLTRGSDTAIKNLAATTVKLNGTNYFLWVQLFKLFIDAQWKA